MSPATYPRIQDFWSRKLLQHFKPQQLKKVCTTNKKQSYDDYDDCQFS